MRLRERRECRSWVELRRCTLMDASSLEFEDALVAANSLSVLIQCSFQDEELTCLWLLRLFLGPRSPISCRISGRY
jgi:hypothetical protein